MVVVIIISHTDTKSAFLNPICFILSIPARWVSCLREATNHLILELLATSTFIGNKLFFFSYHSIASPNRKLKTINFVCQTKSQQLDTHRLFARHLPFKMMMMMMVMIIIGETNNSPKQFDFSVHLWASSSMRLLFWWCVLACLSQQHLLLACLSVWPLLVVWEQLIGFGRCSIVAVDCCARTARRSRRKWANLEPAKFSATTSSKSSASSMRAMRSRNFRPQLDRIRLQHTMWIIARALLIDRRLSDLYRNQSRT